MSEFLNERKREIDDRLKELRPLAEEYRLLEAAAAALDGVGVNGATRRAASTRTARRPRTGAGRRGRPKGGGARSKQALELVKARPGITIAEIAEAMKIKQNYLYRVLPALAADGLVTKKGRGWHPKSAA